MDINQIYNKTTSYFKDGVKTKKKIFLKLNIMEHKNKTMTLIDLFTHMGEAKLFNYISKTPEYQWLVKNAYQYGFILSYPAGNSYYKYEPWHWRFVGEKLAKDFHSSNAYFYDWDQRKIDGYLVNIFD